MYRYCLQASWSCCCDCSKCWWCMDSNWWCYDHHAMDTWADIHIANHEGLFIFRCPSPWFVNVFPSIQLDSVANKLKCTIGREIYHAPSAHWIYPEIGWLTWGFKSKWPDKVYSVLVAGNFDTSTRSCDEIKKNHLTFFFFLNQPHTTFYKHIDGEALGICVTIDGLTCILV